MALPRATRMRSPARHGAGARILFRMLVGSRHLCALWLLASSPLALAGQTPDRPPEVEAAYAALDNGDLDQARRLFQDLLLEQPDSFEPVRGLAQTLVAQGETAAATSLLLARGDRWMRSEKHRLAARAMRQVLLIAPENRRALDQLGLALALTENYVEAEELLRRAVALGQQDLRTLLHFGSAQWENGNLDGAEQTFLLALETSRRALPAVEQLGRLWLWQGRYPEATRILREAVARDSSIVSNRVQLADALAGSGESEEALSLYRQLVTEAPENLRAHYGLARLLTRAGLTEEAGEQMAVYRQLYDQEQKTSQQTSLDKTELDLAAYRQQAGGAAEAIPQLQSSPRIPEHPTAAVQPPAEGCALTPVGERSGLTFPHHNGATGMKYFPEMMGSGATWIDFDGDGWLDLYLVQSGSFPPTAASASQNRLFRNLGDGRFADVTRRSASDGDGYGQGATAVDIDGDADIDLYLTNYGPDRLLLNNGLGGFEDHTDRSGLDASGWSSSAAFADADQDGDMDLYVTQYIEHDRDREPFCADPATGERRYCDPSVFVGASDLFFLNRGDGTFVDSTEPSGIAPADGRGLGVVFADLDGDQRPDIYVANDLTVNLLFHNLGDGTFEEVGLFSGAAVNRDGKPEAGMGLALGDVDRDGDPDIGVTNFDVETNTLYLNEGDLQFRDISAESGFGTPSLNLVGFGLVFIDLDMDGDLDAYVTNGHIREQTGRSNVLFAQPDLILLGDGRGRFRPVTCAAIGEWLEIGRGLAAADFDNDGDPDLAVQANNGPFELLRNDIRAARWLGVDLRGTAPNTGGVGAKVTLLTTDGPQTRWALAGDSYQSTSDRRLQFGLATGATPASIEIVWPSGAVRRIYIPPTGRYLIVRE